MGDQPVMRVDEVVRVGEGGVQRRPGKGVVERHRPGQQGWRGQGEGGRVFGGADDAYPLADLVERRVAGVAGHHGHLVSSGGQRGGQRVDVAAEAANQDRWVLPRQNQHPQWTS